MRKPKDLVVPEGMKWCYKCAEVKELDSFAQSKNRSDGKHSWCKLCTNTHIATHRRQRKNSGLCVQCGEAAVSGKVLCQPCSDRNNTCINSTRKRLVEAGICTRCCKEKAVTKWHCAKCAKRHIDFVVASQLKRRPEHLAYKREYGQLQKLKPKVSVAEKRCSDCGQMKPATEFYKNAMYKDGSDYFCKPCKIARSSAWKKRNLTNAGLSQGWAEIAGIE